MVKQYEEQLHFKVNQFKAWTKENFPGFAEDNDNGEWCFCDEFYDMFEYALTIIRQSAANTATEPMIDDLLYAIARDNEREILAEELKRHSAWFALLCRRSLDTGYINAQWQFAKHLPGCKDNDDFKEIIYAFLDTGDEYTERMALSSLAELYPEQAEEYAVRFWEREQYEDNEYQKIMVLHVLYQIHSSKLPHYLALAEASEYKYLRQNAETISQKLEP